MNLMTLQKHLIGGLVFLLSNIAWGQYPNIQWQKSHGGSNQDIGNAIQPTPDGGYIIVGEAASGDGDIYGNHGFSECWVAKLNSSGTRVWRHSLGGSLNDKGYSICPTNDGNYIIVGSTNSINNDVTGGTHANSTDCWIIKINSQDGAILWQKTIGGSLLDVARCVKQTSDGGYIVGAYSHSNDGDLTSNYNSTYSDYWIIKLDSIGTIQWQKSLGGTETDQLMSICQTSDGGFIGVGITKSNDNDVSGLHGTDTDVWAVKLDSTGNLLWQKALGGSSYELYVDGRCGIDDTDDGGCIITANTYSADGDVTTTYGLLDCWIIKLNSSGTIEWQKSYGGSNYDLGNSIKKTKDGGYIVAASTKSINGYLQASETIGGYWILKLNPTGNIEWQRRCGASDNAQSPNDIKQTIDGGYIIIGGNYSSDGDITNYHDNEDYWTVKLYPFSIDTNITAVSCFGASTGIVNITPSLGYPPYTYSWSNGSTTPTITGVAAGTYSLTVTDVYASSMVISVSVPQPALAITLITDSSPSNGTNNGSAVAVCQGGTAPYTYTWSNSTATGSTIGNLAAGTYDVTVHDGNGCSASAQITVGLNVATTAITDNTSKVQITPNPTQDIINVTWDDLNLIQDTQISIYNSIGKIVITQPMSTKSLSLDLSSQPSGVYLLTLKNENGILITHKILKL